MKNFEKGNSDNITVPRWALEFVLDHANFQDDGPVGEGWPSVKMAEAIKVLEAACES